jgi:hypothetical protein
MRIRCSIFAAKVLIKLPHTNTNLHEQLFVHPEDAAESL